MAAGMLQRRLFVDCDDYEAGGNRFGAAWQQRIVQLWEDHLPRNADAITVNTRFLQERYKAQGIPTERIQYVPNGVAPSRLIDPHARRVAGLRAGLGLGSVPVVVYVGTLSKTTHNVDLLLEAFALALPHVPDARLLLVGDGEDRAELERRSEALGLGEHALFIGAVAAHSVPVYLALAACSVDPVADDAVAAARSPLKIVESLALGVPVVTGDVGDRREMLGQEAGVLVAPGDAQALADGLVVVLKNQQYRGKLAAGARERSAAYRWDQLALQWLNIYR
jgi:glycosyltransferase involved in cell wall biosynthesis